MSKWLNEIDSLRGIAILADIATHVTDYFHRVDHIDALVCLNIVTFVFSSFAVPLFIFK